MVNKDSTQKTQIVGHVARLPNNAPAKLALYESEKQRNQKENLKQFL